MDKIKKFFEKKKADTKFKLAGEGHRLDQSAADHHAASTSSFSHLNTNVSAAQQQAAAAAFARLEKKKDPTPQQRSAALIRAQALKELEQDQQHKKSESSSSIQKSEQIQRQTHLAVTGVFYKCPLIGPEVLPKIEMEQRIKQFLLEQLDDTEAGLTACLLIHTANKNPEKIRLCIETLFRYLDNIIQHPTEEKFQKIRVNNKVYQEKVAPLEGVNEFLKASGFQLRHIPNREGELEEFWIYQNEDPGHIETVSSLRDGLISAEPIRPELDRGVQVLLPSQAAQRIDLPTDFFCLTAEELKREQQLKTDQVERQLMLRTKAMRMRDEQVQQRKYRFTLIRVKFPDGLVLQGTFKVTEPFQSVRLFVQDALQDPGTEFDLLGPSMIVPISSDTEQSTLSTLNLVPSAVLHFKSPVQVSTGYLKDEFMVLMQDV